LAKLHPFLRKHLVSLCIDVLSSYSYLFENFKDHGVAQKNVEMIRKSDKIKQQMGERPNPESLNTVSH
jgi:hypothetical protein